MRDALVLLMGLISSCAFGQRTSEMPIKPRLAFVSDKIKATDTSQYIINNRDTLYAKYRTDFDSIINNDILKSSESILNQYKALVFMYSDENSEIVHELKQWAAPIVIYLDKKLPKDVQEEFVNFFSHIDDINNLEISFTSKLEQANYYIKVTSENVNGYAKDYKFYSEEGRVNSIFTGATYNLLTDDNNKFYSGILSIHPNNKNNSALLKQLKQVFFMSLGNFYIGITEDERSMLSKEYDNSDAIFDFDRDILRIHYALIYDQKINGTTFSNFYESSNHNK